MAKNRNFNLGNIDKIRYKPPSRSWSIKVPKPRRDGLNYCDQPIKPSPDNGVLANLARKIPNADVFAFYKSAYNRWTKALGRYPEYEETSVIDDIPYRNFYFKSCKSVTGFWEVKYRDDGQLEFGVDINTDKDTTPSSTLDLGDLLSGLNSQTISCDGTASIIKDGEPIQLNGDVQVIDHPEQILCENGSCTEGIIYLPLENPNSEGQFKSGYIQYPVSPESENNYQVYQSFGNNIFYQLDTEIINPEVYCYQNCATSTNYGNNKPYVLIEYAGKQYLSNNPPVSFNVEQANEGGYKHTWQLPEGCGSATESFVTTEPVESYTLAEGATGILPANPDTNYCNTNSLGTIEFVGLNTYSTSNTPISYSVSGTTATISDTTGVIGTQDISGLLIIESSQSATPNTNYCSGKPKAVLSWSSGTIETLNTPISYQLRSNIVEWGNGGVVQGSYNTSTAVNSASIQSNANKLLIDGQIETFDKPVASWQNIPQSQLQVDWGGGDVEIIEGASAIRTTATENIPSYIWSVVGRRTLSDGTINDYQVNIRSCFTPTFYPLFCGGSSWYIVGRIFGYVNSARFPSSACGTPFYNFAGGLSSGGIDRLNQGADTNGGAFPASVGATYSIVSATKGTTVAGTYSNVIKTIITSNTGAISERWGNLNPQITTITSSCILRVTFTDGTTQDLSYPTCPTVQNIPGCTVAIALANSTTENIQVNPCPDFVNVINNELTVFDSTGQIGYYEYGTEPTNFIVDCYEIDYSKIKYNCGINWRLNFQPQNITYTYPDTCKPFNIVTNIRVNEGGCCGKATQKIAGRSGTFDAYGIHNPPTLDCRVDPYSQDAPQACYPVGSTYLGYYEGSSGDVYTMYRFEDTEEVLDTCAEQTYKISIYDATGLVREDIICGDPTSSIKITGADGINFRLYVGVNGIIENVVDYQNYDPTSNPALFKIVQLPYQEVIDDSGSQIFPPEYELNYQCTNRYAGGNGPFTVDYFYNEALNKWVVNILDADGNIVGTQYLDSEPSINDASKTPNINTLNQDPYLTCTCPDHDRKIYYYDPKVKDEGYISDWSGDNSAGAPNILGTRCCKHVFSVLNQLGVAEKYIPEDFPTDPVPEKYQNPALIGDEATSSLRPNDINRFKGKFK